jgi:hypothetical protein
MTGKAEPPAEIAIGFVQFTGAKVEWLEGYAIGYRSAQRKAVEKCSAKARPKSFLRIAK